MHSFRVILYATLLAMAALCGSGCGDADNQPAPQQPAQKTPEQWREELKQSAAKEAAQREKFKQSIAPLQEEIRNNDERIKALRAENEALRKQLEATQPTAPATATP